MKVDIYMYIFFMKLTFIFEKLDLIVLIHFK